MPNAEETEPYLERAQACNLKLCICWNLFPVCYTLKPCMLCDLFAIHSNLADSSSNPKPRMPCFWSYVSSCQGLCLRFRTASPDFLSRDDVHLGQAIPRKPPGARCSGCKWSGMKFAYLIGAGPVRPVLGKLWLDLSFVDTPCRAQ